MECGSLHSGKGGSGLEERELIQNYVDPMIKDISQPRPPSQQLDGSKISSKPYGGRGSTKGCRLDKRTCSELPTLVYHHFAAHWQMNATMQQLVDTIYANYIVPYDERDSNVKICSNCKASSQQNNFLPHIVRTNNIVASMAAAASCMAMWTEWYSSSSSSSQTHRGHGRLDLFSTPGLSCESLRGQQHHKTDTLLPMLPPLFWSHPAFLLFFFAHMRTVVCACFANVDASGILAT